MGSFFKHPSWIRYKALVRDVFSIDLQVEPTEHHLSIRDHTLRVDEWLPAGNALGTVILVHGAGGNGRILAPFAAPLMREGWRVLAPDLPGFGLTVAANTFNWDYGEWPKVIAALADQQDGPVALYGLSLGGMTALMASSLSERVKAVAVTTLLDMTDPDIFDRLARWKWLGRLSRYSIRFVPWLFDRVWLPLSLVTPLGRMSDQQQVQHYFKSDPLIGHSFKPARFFRTLHQASQSGTQLNCPLLLCHPGEDCWTPPEISLKAYHRVNGEKHMRVLTNGGHLPLEQPAYRELNETVLDFLN